MKKKHLRFIIIMFGFSLISWGVISIWKAPNVFEAIALIPVVIILSGIAGFILSDVIGSLLAEWFHKNFYWYSGNIKAPPPEFSKIRAKIANGNYAEAEKELRSLLAKDKGNPHIVLLLAEIFIDKTHEIHKAEGLLTAYLKKDDRSSDDLKFVMMLVDIYLESSRSQLALEILQRELSKNYDKNSLKSLKNRISSIRNILETK
ncbi:MAG TPA: tetratricopeptide repeat protein [Victivallales bacterium]|nr:tetratricopeptide repeat protein [Victivallales bacterium]HRR05933.1 tetratricopeptide repeat protein [Victivallales bacterium]HRR27760.1 tetratricopeptide repeat protein [Victivallales bacterium]